MSARIIAALGVLLGALVSAGTVRAAPSAEATAQARAAGFAALDRGDLGKAEARFADALGRGRGDADALGGMRVVRLRQHRFADAADLLARASRTGRAGQWAEALATARYFAGLESARALFAAGRIAEARVAGEVVLASGYGRDDGARELLAQIAAAQGRHADAAMLYQRTAHVAAPADAARLTAAGLRETAIAAAAAGDAPGAEAALRDALAADPGNVWVRHDLAAALIARDRREDAAATIRPLLGSGDPQALHAAALIARALDRPLQAEALLARIAPADRSAPVRALTGEVTLDAEIARVQASASHGGSAAAVAGYRRIAARPGVGAARQALIANAVLDLGDGDAATAIAAEGLAAQPMARGTRLALAEVLARSARLARRQGAGRMALARLRAARAAWPETRAPADFLAGPLAALDGEIVDLWRERADRLDGAIAYRHRSGDAGLGRLDEVVGSARVSTAAGSGAGRIELHGEVVALDAGTPRGGALARFGLGPTLAAAGAPRSVGRQRARGVAAAIGYASDLLGGELGLTTVGAGAVRAIGRVAGTAHPATGVTAGAWVERRPVTDSIVAYAGARDPVGGALWGRVMRTGAGLSLAADHAGGGVYAQVRYGRYAGRRVRANEAGQLDAGGYLRALARGRATVTAGLNLDLQRFRHNDNGYGFGTGGYFSPQRFVAVSVPLRYRLTGRGTELSLSATPGMQRYREAATYDPEHRAAGFAFAAQLVAARHVGQGLRLGVEAGYDGFGSYREWRLAANVRASFGSGR